MSKTFHALAHLTAHELETLDREVLAEQVKRTLSKPNAVVVEPDAPESVHEQAIQTVLRHKGIKS